MLHSTAQRVSLSTTLPSSASAGCMACCTAISNILASPKQAVTCHCLWVCVHPRVCARLSVCVCVCVCVQVDLYRTWLTCSTLVLAFSFSFSNTLKNVLEAIIYLFVVHPFDVGDGILVGTTGTDYYKVCTPAPRGFPWPSPLCSPQHASAALPLH